MVHSFRSRTAGSGALILPLIAFMGMLPFAALADTPAQRQDIATALRQVDALERLVQHSEASASAEPGQRYHFDYPRLLADLARMRAGLQDYLTPSRAQPRDPAELVGQYRFETSSDSRTERGAEP